MKYLQICLHFYIHTESVNYHKVTPCSHPCGSNSVVAFYIYQEKNGNKYKKDLEMEIHSVINKDTCELCKHARCWNAD